MDKSQYKFLKSLLSEDDTYIPEDDRRIQNFLRKGWLTIDDMHYVVTEEGKSELYAFQQTEFKIKSTFILTVIAIVLTLLGWLFPKEEVKDYFSNRDSVQRTEALQTPEQ